MGKVAFRGVRGGRGGRAAVSLLSATLVAAALAGCVTSPAKVSGDWKDGAVRGPAYSRILVVGVSAHVDQRCSFEFFMVSRLRSENTRAVASCDTVAQKEPLTVESIEQAAAKVQADAVLATNFVAGAWDMKEGGSRDTRGSAAYKATDMGYASDFYGAYGVPVIYADFKHVEASMTAQAEVHIASRLFETKGKALVYTLDTRAKGLMSSDVAQHDIADAIASRLRKDGVIR